MFDDFTIERSRAWARARAALPSGYGSGYHSWFRCRMDAENPDHEDHELARQLWLLYLQERIEG